jgi:hypothetical protein
VVFIIFFFVDFSFLFFYDQLVLVFFDIFNLVIPTNVFSFFFWLYGERFDETRFFAIFCDNLAMMVPPFFFTVFGIYCLYIIQWFYLSLVFEFKTSYISKIILKSIISVIICFFFLIYLCIIINYFILLWTTTSEFINYFEPITEWKYEYQNQVYDVEDYNEDMDSFFYDQQVYPFPRSGGMGNSVKERVRAF